MLKRLKLWWAVRSVMTAIALDPDKFYVLIYDPNRLPEDLPFQLHRMLTDAKIGVVLVGADDGVGLHMMPVVKADVERLLARMEGK